VRSSQRSGKPGGIRARDVRIMLFHKFFPVISVAGLFALTPDANAQGMAGTCARILMEFVGKPLITAAAGEIGGALGRYLAGLAHKDEDGTATLTKSDIEHLKRLAQREGLSECELRQQLEAATGTGARNAADDPDEPPPPSRYYNPYRPPSVASRPPPASVCVTSAGWCALNQVAPAGMHCGCQTYMGVFYGITQ
jgi:hypothetical protein